MHCTRNSILKSQKAFVLSFSALLEQRASQPQWECYFSQNRNRTSTRHHHRDRHYHHVHQRKQLLFATAFCSFGCSTNFTVTMKSHFCCKSLLQMFSSHSNLDNNKRYARFYFYNNNYNNYHYDNLLQQAQQQHQQSCLRSLCSSSATGSLPLSKTAIKKLHSCQKGELLSSTLLNSMSLCKIHQCALHQQTNTEKKSELFKTDLDKQIGQSSKRDTKQKTLHELKENIYTIPNCLTVGRILVSPLIGYWVIHEQFLPATCLFVVAGFTDLLDGYIARNYPSQASILGSVIDPLADKFLVALLTISLTAVHIIPIWLALLILARDAWLVCRGFYVRYITLPPPITLRRYFDFSHPTASVQPTFISKVNTSVQLLLLTASLMAPLFDLVDHSMLKVLWGATALTTTWSAFSYRGQAYTVLRGRHKS